MFDWLNYQQMMPKNKEVPINDMANSKVQPQQVITKIYREAMTGGDTNKAAN